MRKHFYASVLGVLLATTCVTFAENNSDQQSAQIYLNKYQTYRFWVDHLPTQPDPRFLEFIEPTTPLTQTLRDKWLYQLAKHQDWFNFNLYYRSTEDLGLRCYAQMARYRLGQPSEAIQDILPLWLDSRSQQSSACQTVFKVLQEQHAFTQNQMTQRIALALAENQGAFALELLKQSGSQYGQETQWLHLIAQNPRRITSLSPSPLAGAIYLYGLNLMISRNIDAAIALWQAPQSTKLLSPEQNQQFLARIALYKALRNQKDAETWLTLVEPAYCTPILRDWKIRYALLQQNWQKIVDMTADKQSEPFQQYWRARALDRLDRHTEAHTLYSHLASKRTYYGFLASIALHQTLSFEFEPTPYDAQILSIYKPVTDDIAQFYHSNQAHLASRIIHDFSSELSKKEKSTLLHWVAKNLHWTGKAIYACTQDETLQNQLMLRFPLTYRPLIQKLANQYHISPALIYAVIRQESTFFENIKSDAGAYGLMQILPRTAKITAKKAKIPYANPKELFLSEKNLQIGTAYLNTLNQQFKGHPILILASYNAGPKQVRYWLKNHPPQEMDIWVETLPWQETRNYLKNVIAFYAVYQYRMHQTPNLSEFWQPFTTSSTSKTNHI